MDYWIESVNLRNWLEGVFYLNADARYLLNQSKKACVCILLFGGVFFWIISLKSKRFLDGNFGFLRTNGFGHENSNYLKNFFWVQFYKMSFSADVFSKVIRLVIKRLGFYVFYHLVIASMRCLENYHFKNTSSYCILQIFILMHRDAS